MPTVSEGRPRSRKPTNTERILGEILRVQEQQLDVLEVICVLLNDIASNPDPGPTPGPTPGPVTQLTIIPGTPTPKKE